VISNKEKNAETPSERELITNSIAHSDGLQTLKIFEENGLHIFPADRDECLKLVNEFAKTKTEKDLPKLLPITRWSSSYPCQICSVFLIRKDNTLEYDILGHSTLEKNPVQYANTLNNILETNSISSTFLKETQATFKTKDHLPEALKNALILKETGIPLYKESSEEKMSTFK
jgi:hypothetical protein